MSPLLVGVAIILGVLVAGLGLAYTAIRHPCNCGRTRMPYFVAGRHEVGPLMFVWVAMMAAGLILALITVSWFSTLTNALILTWHARRWWFHEKDKIKKKAAKLAGRVGVNATAGWL